MKGGWTNEIEQFETMPLTDEQKQLIVDLDIDVKSHLARGANNEVLLAEMLHWMTKIKELIIDSPFQKEIDLYLAEYDGFYYYMKLLEQLAQGIKDGTISVPR